MTPPPPYLAAAAVYAREPCARTFEHDLFLHLMHGIVVSTPDLFAMVRPVWSHWPDERLLDPAQTDMEGDTWWLWLVAGNPAMLWDAFPAKKFLAFERRNTPKRWEYERLRRLWRSRMGTGFVPSQWESGPTP